jgi:hypothetical protein
MPSSSKNENLSRVDGKDDLRAAVRDLRARGVTGDVDALVRAGATEMIRRSLAAFDAGHASSVGWLATVVRSGGPWNAPTPDDGLTERDRQRCAAFDSLMAEHGLTLGSAA